MSIGLAVALVAGCGKARIDDGVATRDSAGIRIVENRWADPAALPVCTIASEPSIDIGVVDGDPAYQFYRVFDARYLPDGRIAVVNQGSSEVRFYDEVGRYAGAVGRDGEGPGEFRGARAVWQVGDSLLVWDDELQRFSVFGSDGAFRRSFALSPRLMNEPMVLGPIGDRLHLAYHALAIEPPGFAPQTRYHMRYDWNGALVDTLAGYPFGTYGPIGRPEDYMAGRTLFEARTSMAASGNRVFVATGDVPEVRVLDPDGRVVEIVRWPDDDRAVRQEDIDRYRTERLARATNPEWRRSVLLSIDEVPVSERFPAVADLGIDDDGRIWVQQYSRPGAAPVRQWLVFGPDRRLACRAEVQAGLTITHIRRDRLIGIEEDASDVEHVRAYRVTRDGAP